MADRAIGPAADRPDWTVRAAAAEDAVVSRHVRRLAGLPGTALAVVSWPATPLSRPHVRWEFWWQAHLLDCAIDAWHRAPSASRTARVRRLIRTIRLRNLGGFTNDYYDDMAWIALALQRSGSVTGRDQHAIPQIATAILDAWSPPAGGIPWRVDDQFFNAPANGPGAILLARCGFRRRAQLMADWMQENLRLPQSELIADGLVPGEPLQPTYYTYCQGVVLGAELELALGGGPRTRVHRLVAAVDGEMARDGVLPGHGGGNGGLFTGILARYLALVSTELPGSDPADLTTRRTAGRLVLDSATAAWEHRAEAPGGPVFGPDWASPAVLPRRGRHSSPQPERDLSVQLSGWMLMEAAARLTSGGVADVRG